jgi:ribonucleoside-diphosphate reductase alpha chain
MAKEGSTVSGLMDSLATMTSLALQYGVPLRDLTNKFAHVRFEPAGFTGNSEIPIAKSIVDYVFRWMGSRFLPRDQREALGLIGSEAYEAPSESAAAPAISFTAAPAPVAAADPAPAAAPAAAAAPVETKAAAPWVTATTPAPADANIPAAERITLPVVNSNGNGHTNGNGKAAGTAVMPSLGLNTKVAFSVSADSPSCAECGSIMVRNGSCYKCLNCGSTSGCS